MTYLHVNFASRLPLAPVVRAMFAAALCTGAAFVDAQPAPGTAPASAATSAARSAENILKIGVIGPFTGPSSDFGLPMLNGIQMAVDEINAGGGYLGRKIQIDQKDDQANPDVGLKMAQALIADKVVATIGFCNTGVALKAVSVFQDNRVPLIVPCATGTPVTAKYPAATSYIFRTSPRDSIQAPFVIDDLVKRKLTHVAVFADSTGYGTAGLKDLEAALAARKLKPVYVSRFALGVTDLSEDMKAAKAAGADAIFSYTVGPENAVIARAKSALKWNVPQVGGWPLSFPSFIENGKEAAEGAMMAQTFIAEPSNERRASFLTSYARRFNVKKIPVPMAAAQGYDAVYILVYSMFGIRNADLSGPSVKAALENLPKTYYGVTATFEKPFRLADKDATTANMLVMGVVKNGVISFAYPEDAQRNLFVQRKQ